MHENVGRGGTRRSWRAAATTNTTQEAEEDVLQVSKGKGVYGPPLPQDASEFRTFFELEKEKCVWSSKRRASQDGFFTAMAAEGMGGRSGDRKRLNCGRW